MAPKVVAVIPVKPLAQAKGRLAPVLSLAGRQALTLMGLQCVLEAVQRASLVEGALVIGSDEVVRRLAAEHGAEWLADPGWDLNESLRQGFAHTVEHDADACLFLPADLPLLAAAEVDSLVEASHGCLRLVLAPAPDGGTNSILLPRGTHFQMHMGVGSMALHAEEARQQGLVCEVVEKPGLALDVDTPEDLRRLRERLPGLEEMLQQSRGALEAHRQSFPARNERE